MKPVAATPKATQRGAVLVEFALGAMVFFTFMLGVIELARALYLWSSMVEVTRRAARGAATADFSSAAQLAEVRKKAFFAKEGGGLLLGGTLGANNLSIDYLNGNLVRVDPMPSCPAQNLINCNTDPEGASCIRFVRVRLCTGQSGADCAKVDYVSFVGTQFFPGGPLQFPTFATVTPVATLGFQPGVPGGCL